jgi:allantoin racemase
MSSALQQQMARAVKDDEGHVLILGCTGMMGVATQLQDSLARDGIDVPVVDPVAAAMKLAETTVALGLRQSRLTYHKPKAYTAAGSAA